MMATVTSQPGVKVPLCFAALCEHQHAGLTNMQETHTCYFKPTLQLHTGIPAASLWHGLHFSYTLCILQKCIIPMGKKKSAVTTQHWPWKYLTWSPINLWLILCPPGKQCIPSTMPSAAVPICTESARHAGAGPALAKPMRYSFLY